MTNAQCMALLASIIRASEMLAIEPVSSPFEAVEQAAKLLDEAEIVERIRDNEKQKARLKAELEFAKKANP